MALKDNGLIDLGMIGFFIGITSPSEAEFGGFSNVYVKQGDDSGYGFHSFNLTGNHWWQVKLEAA